MTKGGIVQYRKLACPRRKKDCDCMSKRGNYDTERYKGFFCSGIPKKPKPKFDVIRLCITSVSGTDEKFDMTPDEALEIIAILSNGVDCWINKFKPYNSFLKLNKKQGSK